MSPQFDKPIFTADNREVHLNSSLNEYIYGQSPSDLPKFGLPKSTAAPTSDDTDVQRPCAGASSGPECVSRITKYIDNHPDLDLDGRIQMLVNGMKDVNSWSKPGAEADQLERPTEVQQVGESPSNPLVPIGSIKNRAQLDVRIAGADVTIRHTDRPDIGVTADHPNHWSIHDGVIQQTKVQTQSTYSFTITGNRGSSILNEDENMVITSGNGNNVTTRDGNSIVTTRVHGKQPDKIEIEVPDSYSGSLKLAVDGVGSTKIDGWNGSDVSITSRGIADIDVGNIKETAKVTLDIGGTGSASLRNIEATSFDATDSSIGSLNITNLIARNHASLTKSSLGNIKIERLFAGDGLDSRNNGTGTVSIGDLRTSVLDLDNDGIGNISIRNGVVNSGYVFNSGIGKITAHGDINVKVKTSGLGAFSRD